MIAKQDKLFYMAINILMNIATDFSIEKKIVKKKIVNSLIRLLERNDFHLLIVILLFLRKLSIISENVQTMVTWASTATGFLLHALRQADTTPLSMGLAVYILGTQFAATRQYTFTNLFQITNRDGHNNNRKLELKLVDKLNRFFTCNNVTLLKLSLGIMKNICFNKEMRKAIATSGYIPKIVPLLNNTNYRFISIVLLYLLSLDKENRDYFAYEEMQ